MGFGCYGGGQVGRVEERWDSVAIEEDGPAWARWPELTSPTSLGRGCARVVADDRLGKEPAWVAASLGRGVDILSNI